MCGLTGSWGQPCFITESASSTTATIKQPTLGPQTSWTLSQLLHTRCVKRFCIPYQQFCTENPNCRAPACLNFFPNVFVNQLATQKEVELTQFGLNVYLWKIIIAMSISLGSVRALFLSPSSAKQHVDVCCISIKHSLFQRVHVGLFTVWFYFHATVHTSIMDFFLPRCYEVKSIWFRNCMVSAVCRWCASVLFNLWP